MAKFTVDKAVRIVLSKPLRDAPLRKEHGIWVFRAGEPLSAAVVEKTVRRVRGEREELNSGKSR